MNKYEVKTEATRKAKLDLILAAAELYKQNKGQMLFDAKTTREELEITFRFPRPDKSDPELRNFTDLALGVVGSGA